MPPTIGIYLGTASESIQNIEEQLRAWERYLNDYNLELFGSASVPAEVLNGYSYVRTTTRKPPNALVKQLTTYRDATEYAQNSNPDALLQIWNYPGHALGLCFAGIRFGLPVITRYSGDHFREYTHFSIPRKLAYFFYLNVLGRLSVFLSDSIIALGPHGEEQLNAHGASTEKIHRLPPAASLEERFHPTDDTVPYREALDLPENKTVLLYVGRLSRLKGMEFMREVIHSFYGSDEYLFLLVGAGEYNDLFTNEFSDDLVRAPGYVDYSEIDLYYKAADAYIHCSPFEGIPLVILEALRCDLPVVARRAGDIEFVSPNVVDSPLEMIETIRSQSWENEWRNQYLFEEKYQRQTLHEVFDGLL